MHRIVSRLRQHPSIATIFDHRPRILISHGQIVNSELRRAGLTKDDLYGLLRQQGVLNLDDAYLVIFEQRGQLSVIRRADVHEPEPELIRGIQ